MSDIQHDWVKEQVGDLQDKSPDNKDAWIGNALKGKKGIVNAQDVFVIQSALKSLGHDPGKIDGVFRSVAQKKAGQDSDTMKAIKDFQSKNSITSNGQVGPETIAKLIEKLGTSAKPEAPAPAKPEAPAPAKPEAPAPAKPEAPAPAKPEAPAPAKPEAPAPAKPEAPAPAKPEAPAPAKPEAPAPAKPEAPAPAKPEAPAPAKPEAPAVLDRLSFLEKNKNLLASAGMSLQSEIKVDETDNDKYQLLQLDHSKNQFTLKSSDGKTQEVDSGNLRIWTNQNLRIEASSDGSFIFSTLSAEGKAISTITSKQKMTDGNTLQQQVQDASGASSKGLSFSK